MSKSSCFLLFIITTIFTGYSQPLLILDKDEIEHFGTYTSVLEDHKRDLIIDEVIKMDSQFIRWNKNVFTTSKSGTTFWIKFKVKNVTDNQYYLIVDNPLLYELNVYSVNSEKINQISNSGSIKEISKRTVRVNNFVIPVHLRKGESETFYIRYYTNWRMELPLSIKTSDKVIENTMHKSLWYGIYYGILLISVIYNFAIFRFFKRKSYLYFLLFIFSTGFVRALNQGFSNFIFPTNPQLEYFFLSLPISMVGISLIIFTMHFLKTKTNFPKSHLFLKITNIFIISASFIILFSEEIWYKVLVFIMLTLPLYLIYMSINAYRTGSKHTRFYILGATCYQIIIFISGIRNSAILPFSFGLYNVADLGFILVVIFFTIAMGEHYILLEKEKKEIQKELNKELKVKLEERKKAQETQKKLNNSLKNTNLDLDNFIYSASHELKSPVTNIEGLMHILESESLNKSELKNILDKMNISIQKFKHAISDLTEVAKVRKMRDEDMENNNIGELFKEVEHNLKDMIEGTKTTFDIDTKECPVIRFSKKNLRLILYNLIHNAIKFRHPDRSPKIHVKTSESDKYYELSVRDNGMGIKKNNKDKVFSLFTKAHSRTEGRGVGLYMVKRIIENEDGMINLESVEGEGSSFNIYLKKIK